MTVFDTAPKGVEKAYILAIHQANAHRSGPDTGNSAKKHYIFCNRSRLTINNSRTSRVQILE